MINSKPKNNISTKNLNGRYRNDDVMFGLCEEVAQKSRSLIARQLELHAELAALAWWGKLCARIKSFEDLCRELDVIDDNIDALCTEISDKIAAIYADYTEKPDSVEAELQAMRQGAFAGLSCAGSFAKKMLGDGRVHMVEFNTKKKCENTQRRIVNAVLDIRSQDLDRELLSAGTCSGMTCKALQSKACNFARDMYLLHQRQSALHVEDLHLSIELEACQRC